MKGNNVNSNGSKVQNVIPQKDFGLAVTQKNSTTTNEMNIENEKY